jgi:glycerophosphoryl diester phosphodiesterase
MPTACRNTLVFVPVNYRALSWGWPNLFAERLRAANSELFVVGPFEGSAFVGSIDDPVLVDRFLHGFAGGDSTDGVDTMGPHLKGAPQSGA